MIRTMTQKKDHHEIVTDIPLKTLIGDDPQWYWVDFNNPSDEEVKQLSALFHFHPLAIEDCLHGLQRPKVDFYDEYAFFVLHALNKKTIEAREVALFVGKNYVVSFHVDSLKEVDEVWRNEQNKHIEKDRDPYDLFHLILDNLVDAYFAPVYQIEDELDEIENNTKDQPMRVLMNQLFDTRSDLLKLRHTILPMRDLLYRLLASQRSEEIRQLRAYYTDVYDHLLKLAEMVESNREITADIRDSHLSINADRMNTVMMTLTVIATIFMPLTFIAGVYGMNFTYMPELKWHDAYFYVLGLMALIGLAMFLWFKHKGWFDR